MSSLAASGVLGFGIFTILFAAGAAFLRAGEEIRSKMIEALQQAAARSSDPQAQQVLEFVKTPQGLALMLGLVLIVIFAFFVILSSLSGAATAALSRQKSPH